MHKAVLVGLTILAISTSAASAWTHRSHHRGSMNSNASAAMYPNQPMNAQAAAPGVSSKDHEMYMKNLHDSGYDQKKDRGTTGNMKRE